MAVKELRVRIIGGKAKGRTLTVPAAGTRPMTGRARESVFSILSPRLVEARVLDLFAGSGGLGLEALSRGASDVVFVEKDRNAVTIIERNVAAVGLGGSVLRRSLPEALTSLSGLFDVVFIDPPYADTDDSVTDILRAMDSVLTPTGIVVVHRQARSSIDTPEFLTCVDERRYGDAVVTMFERLHS